MIFRKILGQPPKKEGTERDSQETKELKAEVTAFFEISSAINSQKELTAILNLIAQHSLPCLKANRATVFLMDEKSGVLKTLGMCAVGPLDEQVSFLEEKEVAHKVLKHKKPFHLRDPKDLAEFFKDELGGRKITSLLSIPLILHGQAVGALSVVRIDRDQGFTDKNLQFLSTLGHQAHTAMEKDYLHQEVRKGADFRKDYEQYLDNILVQLQSLSEGERRRTEEHIGKLLPGLQAEETESEGRSLEEKLAGGDRAASFKAPLGSIREQEKEAGGRLTAEADDDLLSVAEDMGDGEVFIPTPTPKDLGEQFTLRARLAKGEKPVELTCKVVWTNQYGLETRSLGRGMGVKFVDLPPDIQKRIEKYFQSRKTKELFPPPKRSP